MNKKAIAILGAIFILIVGTLGFLIYQKSNNPETETGEPQVTEEPQVEEPTTEEPTEPAESDTKAVRLTDDSVVSPILVYQGNGISYFNRSGQLFQTNFEVSNTGVLLNNKRALPIPVKEDISRVLWPLAGVDYIAEMGNGSTRGWSFYNTLAGKYTDIPQEVYSLDWMPTGDKIMFVWVDGNGKATLNIGNPDTTGYQTLTDLYEPNNEIAVSPDGKNVLFYQIQNIDQTKNTINMVTADGKVFSSVVKDGYNRGVRWAPDSKQFLFGKRNPSSQKYELWVGNISTGELRNLGVNTTVQKAVWSKDSKTVYAGMPVTGNAGESLTEDNLYAITVDNASKKEYIPGVAVDVQDMFYTSDEKILFFRNAQDNALYYIKL